ncbi:MAG: tetratricopeptide repeat protein, partial [Bacteroidales bacterium]|nr:tetratricopeptide repeat protein [Bacteroidales bacterium]
MLKRIAISFVALLMLNNAFSQEKEPRSVFDKKFDVFYVNPEKACNICVQRIKSQLTASKPNNDSLFYYYLFLGRSYYELQKYDSIYPCFREALLYAGKTKDIEKIDNAIITITEFFTKTFDENIELSIPKRKNETSDEFYFRVKRVLKINADSMWVVLSGGEFDGIFKGAKGEAFGIYSAEVKGRENRSLGSAEVISVTRNSSTVIVNLHDTTGWQSKVNRGDMVRLPAITDKKSYKSILFELAQMNIDFNNVSSEPLYHARQFLFDDNREFEEFVLKLMCKDVVATADMIKPLIPENPQWDILIKSGKYGGKKMVDVMAEVTPNDIRSFLSFIKSFPGKYMGHTWKINEIFATWIINNSPLGEEDLKSMLLTPKSDAELDTIFAKYKTDIEDLEMQIRLQIYAEDSASDGKFDGAYKCNTILTKMADFYNNERWKAWAFYDRAYILDRQEKYDDAIAAYLKAKEMFIKTGDVTGQAFSVNNVAVIYNSQSKYNDALKYYEESFQIKVKTFKADSSDNTIKNIANSLIGKGQCLVNLSRSTEAYEVYQLALKYLEKSNSFSLVTKRADLYNSMGKTQKNLGNLTEAKKYYNMALKIKRELGDRTGEADILDNIAYITDNTAEANIMYQQSYQIKIDLGDKSGAGFSMSNAGQTYWTLGEYQKAIDAHNLAVKLRTEANDSSGQAYSYSKLGGLYKASGEPTKAIENYNKAIEIYKKLGKKKEVADIYNDLGANFKKVKDYEKALANYTEAMKIFEQIEAKTDLANSYTDIASIYFSLKDFIKAKEFELKALKLQKETGDKEGQIYAYLTLGEVAFIYDYRPDSALLYYQEALKLAELTDSKSNIAYCKTYIARLKNSNGKTAEAFKLFEENLKTYQELKDKTSEAEMLLELGYSKLNSGDFTAADDYFSKVTEITKSSNDNYNLVQAIVGQSEILRLKGDYKGALELANKSLEINKQQENYWGVATSNLVLGNINNEMGDYKAALAYYHLSDSIYTSLGVEISRTTPL